MVDERSNSGIKWSRLNCQEEEVVKKGDDDASVSREFSAAAAAAEQLPGKNASMAPSLIACVN